MNFVTILFYLFMFLAAASAGALLFSRNVFKSALFLLCCLLAVAALYVLSFAEFLAVAQILVYAGGILVVIVFGIMLTTRMSGRPLNVENTRILAGSLASAVLFALLICYLPDIAPIETPAPPRDMHATGVAIFSDYSLPFEVAGLLLLVALVGAAVITSHLRTKA